MKSRDKIYFSIPNYWYLSNLNIMLLDMIQEEPEKFNNDIVIDSCFGCFPGCVWNGGRGLNDYGKVQANKIIEVASKFNQYGVSLRHTFTNMLIEEKHLNDTIGNAILSLTEHIGDQYGVKNGCTVNSPILFDYIKTNYPNFDCVWSTTKEIDSLDTVNKLSKDNLLVISYNLNNHFDKLDQLKYPENIEILCSEEGCVDDCPVRNWHNLITSQINMMQVPDEKDFQCPRKLEDLTSFFYTTTANRQYFIDIDNIRENYLPRGFNQFKISGRSFQKISVINSIENYVIYFVKPEYRDEIRNKMLIRLFA